MERRTNSVTLLSLPISVVVSARIQMARDAAGEGIMTFTIHYLFKHADLRTHAHFRSVECELCGRAAVELIWDVLLVWAH